MKSSFTFWKSKVKAETGHATAKKQKTEWQSALKKLPGDTTLARDGYWVDCKASYYVVYK